MMIEEGSGSLRTTNDRKTLVNASVATLNWNSNAVLKDVQFADEYWLSLICDLF